MTHMIWSISGWNFTKSPVSGTRETESLTRVSWNPRLIVPDRAYPSSIILILKRTRLFKHRLKGIDSLWCCNSKTKEGFQAWIQPFNHYFYRAINRLIGTMKSSLKHTSRAGQSLRSISKFKWVFLDLGSYLMTHHFSADENNYDFIVFTDPQYGKADKELDDGTDGLRFVSQSQSKL